MGKKYIIELEEKPFNKGGDFLYRVKGFNSLVFDMTGICKLTPYTEPDMEQVRKEAYDKGYENGFIAGHLKAEKSGQSFYEDGHQRGLNDAWEAARTLWNTPNRKEIFGHTTFNTVLTTLTAQESIEKIRQYEQEKEGKIQVGDEIETPSGLKGYVVNFTDDELVHYVSSEGRFGTMGMSAVLKTGRHFPEIVSVLQKMKEA